MRIYLAGPIFESGDHECIRWREEVKSKLRGVEIVDPMERDYRGATDENYKRIVEEDKALIDKCDILLVNHQKPSVGTSMEILYAWQKKKHIVVVSKNCENSPWLVYHSEKILQSLDEAVNYIKEQVVAR